MPTLTEQPTRAFAHCRDARCPGYQQQEVDAVRAESSWTFGENGGDGVFTHMIERSTVEFRAVNAEDVPCPVCAEPREVTGTPRPQYQPLSGHDPLGLLQGPKWSASSDGVPAGVSGAPLSDEEIEAQEREELRREQIRARVRAEMGD